MTLIQLNDTLQDVAMMKYLMLILRIGLTHQVTDNLNQPQTLLHESSCLVKWVAWKSKPECILTVDREVLKRKKGGRFLVPHLLSHVHLSILCFCPRGWRETGNVQWKSYLREIWIVRDKYFFPIAHKLKTKFWGDMLICGFSKIK